MPTEARTHHNLAIVLGRAGRGAAALPHSVEAERLKPTEPPFAYNHGVALFRLGRVDEAIARYAATLRLRSDYTDARFNLAAALASGRASPRPCPTTRRRCAGTRRLRVAYDEGRRPGRGRRR